MTCVRRSTIVLATAFVVVFASFYLWQHPGLIRGRLAAAEIDRAVAYIPTFRTLTARNHVV